MKKQIIYIFLLITSMGFSQTPIIKAKIDTTSIRIGEQFLYKISVDKTKHVILPKLENLKGLEVVSESKIDTIKNSLIKKYILTGFDSGAFYIPQQQVFVKNQAYLTDSLLVNIATIPIDTTKIKKFPIKGIKGEPYEFIDFQQYLWWLIFAIICIGGILYYFIIKKKKGAEEIVTEPSIPPYEEAIQKLHQLDQKLLWQNNKVKRYYSELTEIVRAYIERELKIPALESTTDELINVLIDFNTTKSIETTEETIQKLKKLLQEADLVKFAKSKPLAHEIEDDRKNAESIVNYLKPKPIVVEDEVE
ncbi:hypothetical protein ACE1MK_12955 [Tenacibaculum maritimum]|uniref:hypothetical protein n=1 Tax=Tenacibaculum maritimum TaxID=107401 RepID=UPI0012E6BD37|nr:hypothetical protein [Tenacibaculum maritimum]MCD9581433.1 hypothetical protein [Tenacibaculum maritimum]MCD9635747.1 hypothetical protein [Tenacibaculum maritimum]MDB0601389.1 hypothetical protein [Tenacibaculum maritimum]MDB0611809.1 hypothetical protein [Tenacibaculum maritimum]CAA0167272.1 conserved hypothetical protein [Tenacibaculum maritimum]